MKRKLISGDEVDAIEGRKYLSFRPGERKAIKRKINKRLRKEAKTGLRSEKDEDV